MNYGMIRLACASPKLKVASPSYNKDEIIKLIDEALEKNVRILVTPELSITGYTCADLFFSKALQNKAEAALKERIGIVLFLLGRGVYKITLLREESIS
jgi:NAD+ synthase (glutamine-hydrolysing)